MNTVNEEKLDHHDQELLYELRLIVHAHFPNSEVILFGSVARGQQQPHSDFDVYIITSGLTTVTQERELQNAVLELELKENCVISLLFCLRAQWNEKQLMPLHREILRDGVLL